MIEEDKFDLSLLILKNKELLNLLEKRSLSQGDKIEIECLLYLIESEYAKLKQLFELPYLDPKIFSYSVIESLKNEGDYPEEENLFEQEGIIFDNEKKRSQKRRLSFTTNLTANDYQYWLLIHLLLNDKEIRNTQKTLYIIIDQFIKRIKDKSFKPGDIEYTGSGATRCKTNIRFAFSDLKEMGLVSLYDYKHKESWTLTYLGFFIAASFCITPVDRNKQPLGNEITSFNMSSYYFRLNHEIGKRIEELTKPEAFYNLINRLNMESLELEELKKGPEIFKEYYRYLENISGKHLPEKEKIKQIRQGLNELEKKYPLLKYMDNLSVKFNAEKFFAELMRSVDMQN